ncbi:hypothetical protein [Acinetobacter gyllenbergii]|nr:hypothetical protein [Acinetobacter gyllenbergii]EPH31096.1 hypothetical protein L293_2499 [Acinetobacter gyllenbergii CIP 110306 = MTCC 11365]
MKSTPDQAIYDFSNAIYKLTKINFDKANQPLEKANFLFECVIQLNDLKMLAGCVSFFNQTIEYSLDDEKYTFWLVETPEPTAKFQFLDYLTKEITVIFYNLNLDNCER